jgi:hypothetical protein
MRKHTWIVARAAFVGLGLSLFLGVAALAQGVEAPSGQEPGKEFKPGEYWVGVALRASLSDDERARRSMPKDEGVVVAQVLPSTPADGKLQENDVIVKAGGKTLKSAVDFLGVVDSVKGGKLPLEILRHGRTTLIDVTPVKRPPQAERVTVVLEVDPNLRYETIQKALEWLNRSQAEGTPLRLYTVRPGWMLRPGAMLWAPLPANLTVSVTRQGEKPATIVVKRDDQKWEITEKELDKLPNDIRPYVERMLGRGFTLESLSLPHEKLGTGLPAPPKVVLQPRLEKQIDEMRQRLEQTRKRLEEARKSLDEAEAQLAAPKTEKK